MAYTLKAAWAADALVVIAVDQDGLIKGWARNDTTASMTAANGKLTMHANVTTGTGTFRSAGSRGYFVITASGATPQTVVCTPNIDIPARATRGLLSFVMVCERSSAGNGAHLLNLVRQESTGSGAENIFELDSSTDNRFEAKFYGISQFNTADTFPTQNGSTPYTIGYTYDYQAGGQAYQCLASTTRDTFQAAVAGSGDWEDTYTFGAVGGRYKPDNGTPAKS